MLSKIPILVACHGGVFRDLETWVFLCGTFRTLIGTAIQLASKFSCTSTSAVQGCGVVPFSFGVEAMFPFFCLVLFLVERSVMYLRKVSIKSIYFLKMVFYLERCI